MRMDHRAILCLGAGYALALAGCYRGPALVNPSTGDREGVDRDYPVGLSMYVGTGKWRGEPATLPAFSTPMAVEIRNDGPHDVRVSLADFELDDDRGIRYKPITPYVSMPSPESLLPPVQRPTPQPLPWQPGEPWQRYGLGAEKAPVDVKPEVLPPQDVPLEGQTWHDQRRNFQLRPAPERTPFQRQAPVLKPSPTVRTPEAAPPTPVPPPAAPPPAAAPPAAPKAPQPPALPDEDEDARAPGALPSLRLAQAQPFGTITDTKPIALTGSKAPALPGSDSAAAHVYGGAHGPTYGYKSRWLYGFSYGFRAGLFVNEDQVVGIRFRSPFWYNRPFFYAPNLRPFYPYAAQGLWFYPYALPMATGYWSRVVALDSYYHGSVDDLQRLAMPEGVMPPRAAAAGYVYFQAVKPGARHVWVVWKARSPEGRAVGRLKVPFSRVGPPVGPT
jgi:hypothetical protein